MSQLESKQFAIETARITADHQSEDVVILDLRGLSPVTDFFVICSGTSDRQMRVLADKIEEFALLHGQKPYGVAGLENAAWILLDYVDVVIHVFTRQHRKYYDLELLWGDAPRVHWQRDAEK